MISTQKLKSLLPKIASFRAVVVVPLAILVAYYGLVASDRYVSESYFTIKENNGGSQNVSLGFLNVANPSSMEDEMIMEEYLLSDDMLQYLDSELDLRAHFQKGGMDWFSSLGGEATREEFLEYYRNHVKVYFNETSGLISVEVQAFERAFAKKVLETMLRKAEDFVNGINHQLAVAQQEFLEQQLTRAQSNLKGAKQNLLAFQNKYRMFSPEQEGQSLAAILDTLEADLVKERASLKQLRSYQNTNAPQVVAKRERINALAAQIRDEKTRLVGEGDEKVNDLLAKYTDLQLELEFAKDAYASTLAALEQARGEASKKVKHLVVVSAPSLAEDAKYPDRGYILVTAMIVLLMIHGIVRMVVATVREHQD